VAGTGVGKALFVTVRLGAPWIGGLVLRRHRDAGERLAAVAEDLRRERDEHERLAVLAERVRIAERLTRSTPAARAASQERVVKPACRRPLRALSRLGPRAL
jgi:hypothetical protein